MPIIKVLPHPELCAAGASFEVKTGESLCDALLAQAIEIEHACEKSRACTTCHVVVREGFNSLEDASDDEEDLLDRAWGLTSVSRLSCQVKVADEDLTVEIPKYTINHARENH
jgi:ferredoxin, 2Fe-2S